MLTNRTERLQSHIVEAGFKGYANEKTLSRFIAKHEDLLRRTGYDRNLEVHKIESGKHAGRFVAVVVLGPREPVTFDTMSLAHHGLHVYQY